MYFKNNYFNILSMSESEIAGRIPLWLTGLVVGLVAISLLSLFFYGSYAGLGSSL